MGRKMPESNRGYIKGGFLINMFNLEEKTHLMINCINKIVESCGLNSVAVFRQNLGVIPQMARFGIFEARHAIYYQAPVIATDIFSAKYLVETTKIGPRYFYIWDLDWLYNNKTYADNSEIYNSDIQLIAKNDQHAKLIEQCWKKPSHIIEDFNYEAITRIFA